MRKLIVLWEIYSSFAVKMQFSNMSKSVKSANIHTLNWLWMFLRVDRIICLLKEIDQQWFSVSNIQSTCDWLVFHHVGYFVLLVGLHIISKVSDHIMIIRLISVSWSKWQMNDTFNNTFMMILISIELFWPKS